MKLPEDVRRRTHPLVAEALAGGTAGAGGGESVVAVTSPGFVS